MKKVGKHWLAFGCEASFLLGTSFLNIHDPPVLFLLKNHTKRTLKDITSQLCFSFECIS